MRRTALLAALTLACGGLAPSGAELPVRTPEEPPSTASPRPSRDDFMEPSRPPPTPETGDLARLETVEQQIDNLQALGRETETAPLFEARGKLLERMGRLSDAVDSYEQAATLYLAAEPANPGRASAARSEADRIRARMPQDLDNPRDTAP